MRSREECGNKIKFDSGRLLNKLHGRNFLLSDLKMDNGMPLLQLRAKRQLTLPPSVIDDLHLEVGDYLETQVERNRLVLTVKEIRDRPIPVKFTHLVGLGKGVYGSVEDIDQAIQEGRTDHTE